MNVGSGHSTRVSAVVKIDEIPESVRSHITFAKTDYIDLFEVATGREDCSAEQWARAILERAQLSRRSARRLWSLMGLRLGPPNSPDYVQGWRIAGSGEGWIRLETSSWYLAAEAVCLVDDGHVSVSLSLRYVQRVVAAAIWAVVRPSHQRAVPIMLRQAVRIMTSDSSSGSRAGRSGGDNETHDG
jgi:hypothetical protein